MFKEMLPRNFSWTANLNEKNIFATLDNVIKCNEKIGLNMSINIATDFYMMKIIKFLLIN